MIDHTETVARERAKYTTPLGLEHAHDVINAVAWAHRAEGWGLLHKTSGTQFHDCSIDVLLTRATRDAVDCLGDAEGLGRPQWSSIPYQSDFDGRWVAPYDPSPTPEPPTPPDPGDIEYRLGRVETFLARTFKEW